ncbi:Holliday junction resolvase RuvX [Spiribacter aquaticus]|uniref:Putative pre-16S rRNA nuclease n=1 Tax=Spiribacter aquaticus TaxID=1935996 RepID=A0A557RN61_9GAMM|nr:MULTISPECIES: Holliday junction resolvase RuvX [Spiribacter]AUB77789.1 crossover junction endodeoxyribonuclease RuvA [Spiribacter roseus]KAF0279646.1 crossover junction endodeoxyribonuclease RuvA [Spiribacter roseus]TVO66613.1 Holliday junction resolvase RuvX [Spiribacter aquaticus]
MSATGTYLGFDAGEKRLGVAVGETVTGHARALAVITCRQGTPDWSRLQGLIDDWSPEGLIVGIPRHADGRDSHSTRLAERFAGELARRSGGSVHRIDEHLSSHAARDAVRGRGQRPEVIDAEAARIILETWLSEHFP